MVKFNDEQKTIFLANAIEHNTTTDELEIAAVKARKFAKFLLGSATVGAALVGYEALAGDSTIGMQVGALVTGVSGICSGVMAYTSRIVEHQAQILDQYQQELFPETLA